MNEIGSTVNGDTQNAEVEEVQVPDENATDEEREAYVKKLEDQNKQLFARAKKGEGFVLKDGKWVKPEPQEKKESVATTQEITSELSQTDLITIAKSDLHNEDISEVIEYAKFKKISIAQALTDSVMKGILAEKNEMRRVAEGTNTGSGKRGNAKLSDDALLDNARNGKLPESDDDMRRLSLLQRTKK